MNLQQKALFIVIPLITLLSAGYSYYLYTLKSHQIDQIIETGEQQLHQQYTHFIKMMSNQRYHYDLRKLLIQPALGNSVAQQDREALEKIVTPFWQLLRSENPYVTRMHFHRSDGSSLLRVHLPDKFDDDIAAVRPMLQKIHTDHQPFSAVEMGRHGLFYRVIEPILNEGRYVGAVELGISIDYIMTSLRKLLKVEVFLLIRQEALQIEDRHVTPHPILGEYILWTSEPSEANALQILTTDFDVNLHTMVKTQGSETYLLHKEHMPIIDGGPDVIMVFAQNLTPYINERTNFLWATVIITIIVLLIIVFTLRLTLTPLLNRLEQTNEKLVNKVDEVTQLSIIDTLTQIYNRKHFNASLTEEISMIERYGNTFTIIMFDIDNYKEINDTYGHRIGDQVMIEIVRIVSQNIRDSDLFSRWGGDEFMIILPHQTITEGHHIADKLCQSISTYSFDHNGSVSISCGISEFRKDDNEGSLIQRVDHNLYRAKQAGRNIAVAN